MLMILKGSCWAWPTRVPITYLPPLVTFYVMQENTEFLFYSPRNSSGSNSCGCIQCLQVSVSWTGGLPIDYRHGISHPGCVPQKAYYLLGAFTPPAELMDEQQLELAELRVYEDGPTTEFRRFSTRCHSLTSQSTKHLYTASAAQRHRLPTALYVIT